MNSRGIYRTLVTYMTPSDTVRRALRVHFAGSVRALAAFLTRDRSTVYGYLRGSTVPRVVLAKLEALNER